LTASRELQAAITLTVFAQVYHPVDASGTNLSDTVHGTGRFRDPEIHAAILALQHSFLVQNYDEGAQLGTITVNGVIAPEVARAGSTSGPRS
jgi:hypothetical protein